MEITPKIAAWVWEWIEPWERDEDSEETKAMYELFRVEAGKYYDSPEYKKGD